MPLLAPIALFVYNRPWHIRQTLESLKNNLLAKDSLLFIFADGAKPQATPSQLEQIIEVRRIIREEQWCKEVHIIESEANQGLARSIINGVSRLVHQFGKVIVLEDDMITSPFFLQFMNEALDFYEHEDKVANIHGYIYEVGNLPTTYFLKDAGCWGWATWARGWELFEHDGQKLMEQIKRRGLSRRFDYDNSYPYFLMLQRQVAGSNDSWAIRWYASLFLKNKLTLHPHQSLVRNIGNDASGTHVKIEERYFDVSIAQAPIPILSIPIEENEIIYKKIVLFFQKHFPKNTFWQRIKNKIKKLIHLNIIL